MRLSITTIRARCCSTASRTTWKNSPGERFLITQLHELLSYLGQMGVSAFLINAQQGLIGTTNSTLDVSYLADTVVLLRYFEANAEVRTAISVVKKRTGAQVH